MEIRYTVPYSPLQNGIAKQMNCTLMELSQAMIITNNLLEFLWEYAVVHTAYLCNRSFTKHLSKSMPYEGWYNENPNVLICMNLVHQHGLYYRHGTMPVVD